MLPKYRMTRGRPQISGYRLLRLQVLPRRHIGNPLQTRDEVDPRDSQATDDARRRCLVPMTASASLPLAQSPLQTADAPGCTGQCVPEEHVALPKILA